MTTSRSCARRSTISACRQHQHHRLGRSRLRRSPRKARPARRSWAPTPTRRPASCRSASSLSIQVARPAAVRSQRQERARRGQCLSCCRQRFARSGPGEARTDHRHQWRFRPDLSARQGQEARGPHGEDAAGAGLRQRASGSMTASVNSRRAADVDAQPAGQGGHAAPGDRRQLPLLFQRLRTANYLLGRDRRHRVVARVRACMAALAGPIP